MLKLEKEFLDDIHFSQMKDGQVGSITQWSVHKDFVGRVVQRYKNSLISLGMAEGNCWQDIFTETANLNNNSLRVRLLKNGEKLVVS